jgi:hypothetical protein
MSQPTIIKHIPKEYTEYFIQYFNENKHNYDEFDWEYDELYLRMWGLSEKSKISGHVFATNNYEKPGTSKINSVVKEVLDLFNVDYNEFEAFIKTCYLPISLHVDANRYKGPATSHKDHEELVIDTLDDGNDARQGITIIIPLTFNKNIHTIIFKNIAEDNIDVREFIDKIAGTHENSNDEYRANLPTYEHDLDYRDYIPNIWNKQMIMFYEDPQNNRYARGDQILDYLEVEHIITWEENVAYMFNKQKMHMSNNFKKVGIESKDFILIHTH